MASGIKNNASHCPNKLAILLFIVFTSSQCAFASWLPIDEKGTFVTIKNEISPEVTMRLGCKSGNDNLGQHVLQFGQGFKFMFYRNWWGTTRFWCWASWVDTDGRQMYGTGDVYNRHQRKHCNGNSCVRAARKDGFWNLGYGLHQDGMLFGWTKK